MCAIVDTNVCHEVFSTSSQTEAGKHFHDWLRKPNGGTIVSGGGHLRELNKVADFKRVFAERLQAGRARQIPDDEVDADAANLRAERVCRSNDEDVLALARLSGARLLYTNDRDLQRDFRNPSIINNPRGRVYTTAQSQSVTDAHRTMLSRPRPRQRCPHCGH